MVEQKPNPAPAAAAPQQPLRLASEVFLESAHEEGAVKRNSIILLLALLIHVFFFVMKFPDIQYAADDVEQKRRIMVVRKYVPPPPPRQQQKQVQRKLTKKMPVPDPTPDEPEPIIEPEPEDDPIVIDDDVEMVIGAPEPPPATGPLMPGIGGVTEPELIMETKLEPDYPDMARRARIEGKVILQVVISKAGTVGDITVMREPAADLGFSEAAIAAVEQWRYRPATQNGRPVDVFITVVVTFSLE